MKLFSKRHSVSGLSSLDERRVGPNWRSRRTELISIEARNRLIAEIRFLSSTDDFLEWFILFENQKKEKIFFDADKIDSFSLSELGYKLTDYFEFENFKMVELERTVHYATSDERPETYFDDYRLFDLCEITILFAQQNRRQEVIDRINSILTEENSGYLIIEQLITRRDGDKLKNLINIIRDDNLKSKLKNYYNFEDAGDYVNAAKVSADIINIIFSGLIKTSKKKEIDLLKEHLTEVLVGKSQNLKDKRDSFVGHLDDLLKSSKNLSNDIYDIRHTEQSTIEVKNDNIYKLVSQHNMSLVELVLTTLKSDYVLSSDWETIKQDYIKKYQINPKERLTIVKPKPRSDDSPIDLSEIPF